jgi:hypothetical protein
MGPHAPSVLLESTRHARHAEFSPPSTRAHGAQSVEAALFDARHVAYDAIWSDVHAAACGLGATHPGAYVATLAGEHAFASRLTTNAESSGGPPSSESPPSPSEGAFDWLVVHAMATATARSGGSPSARERQPPRFKAMPASEPSTWIVAPAGATRGHYSRTAAYCRRATA